jgi:hypothetical protein
VEIASTPAFPVLGECGLADLVVLPEDAKVERRTPLSQIEGTRQQRITAATMQDVSRQSRTTAIAMLEAAEGMRTSARAAVVKTRRQLAPPRERA